jgi:hypothetical protein
MAVRLSAMHGAFLFLLALALAGVTAALGFGIFALFKGGDFGRSWSNRLMRLRVLLQFVAILIIVAGVLVLRHGQ